MSCTEGIVDENVCEFCQGGGELGVVGLFPGVEAEVFEEEDITGGKSFSLRHYAITDNVVSKG